MKKYLILCMHLGMYTFSYTNDLTDSFEKVMKFFEEQQSVPVGHGSVHVKADRLGKHVTGWSNSKISFLYPSVGQQERIFIPENAQPHHFLNTPLNSFLYHLIRALDDKQFVEIKHKNSSWRFKKEPVDPHSKATHLVGRKSLLN